MSNHKGKGREREGCKEKRSFRSDKIRELFSWTVRKTGGYR